MNLYCYSSILDIFEQVKQQLLHKLLEASFGADLLLALHYDSIFVEPFLMLAGVTVTMVVKGHMEKQRQRTCCLGVSCHFTVLGLIQSVRLCSSRTWTTVFVMLYFQ